MPAPGPPNKGDIVLANVNFGDGEGPQDKEGKFLGMTRYGGNFRVEFESPKQWIATEIRVVDEIKFNGEWWSLQGAPQFGGSRTRKKRGKGPQQRAVAGKFVGNILSKYKPEAKPKARRKKTHTAKKADRAPRRPRRPVAGDIVEVQDSFLSLSPTFQQVSDEYYGGDHGPKWYLAKLTGIARSRRPGPVRIRAPAGAHYQGIAEVYLTPNDHYRIQLLNAAGEDAGQGTQYVASIRFPPGDGGKKYTWRPARRAVVARH